MFRKSKSQSESAPQGGSFQSAPTQAYGYQVSELQVFDGKGHRAVMTFSADRNGRVIQRLRKGRDWKAHLPHTHM